MTDLQRLLRALEANAIAEPHLCECDTLSERDPYGLAPNCPGAKLDAGKPDMSLMVDFHGAMREVAKVATYGAVKYSRGGWLQVEDGYTRYTAAMLRHTFVGSPIDDESGLLHAAHAAWNALARLEMLLIELGKA